MKLIKLPWGGYINPELVSGFQMRGGGYGCLIYMVGGRTIQIDVPSDHKGLEAEMLKLLQS